ncbi:hypothetical protein AB6N16_20125 [Pseudomonas marginalis]
MTDHFMPGLMRAIQRRAAQSNRESLVDTSANSPIPTSSDSDAEQYKTKIIKMMINHIQQKKEKQND